MLKYTWVLSAPFVATVATGSVIDVHLSIIFATLAIIGFGLTYQYYLFHN